MTVKRFLDIFSFIAVFVIVCIVTMNIPDIDLEMKSLLGHRSIITHSILIPCLFFYYFVKKKDNPKEIIVICSLVLFFSFGVHFSADLISKGWRGTANIKLPGNNSIGSFLSPIWLFINAFLCFLFANSILKQFTNNKTEKNIYFILGAVIALIYFENDYIGRPGEQFFLFIFLHSITYFDWFYASFKYYDHLKRLQSYVHIKSDLFPVKDVQKRAADKTKSRKKNIFKTFLKIIFGIIIFLVILILIFFIIGTLNKNEIVEDAKPSKIIPKNIIKKKKVINEGYKLDESPRAYDVKPDEYALCRSKIEEKYSKTNFTYVTYRDFKAPKKGRTFEKTITMHLETTPLLVQVFYGYIDCKIKVNQDQSITFVSLGKKYK